MSILAATLSEYHRPADSPTGRFLLRIRDVIYQMAGFFVPDEQLGFLLEQCEKRMQAAGVDSLPAYLDLLTIRPHRDPELRQLLNELTAADTRFFCYPAQLDTLRKLVIPDAVKSKKHLSSPQLRVWSAGCSTGEEAYTLAIVLLEERQASAESWDLEVVGTDSNDRVLAKAREGLYPESALRQVPPELVQKYFRPHADQFQVVDEVKSKVRFDRWNLLDESKMVFMKGFDAIFCCNVFVYLDGIAKRRTVQHLYNNLQRGGYLFLGKNESLLGINTDLRLVYFSGTTAYSRPAWAAD